MTRQDAMSCVDRYVRAGYRQPEDFTGAFEEWCHHFAHYALEDVDAAITRLTSRRSSPFWPTPGELMDHLAAVTAGRERGTVCEACHGSTWVESTPYRANGGHIYTGVVRCRACGVPSPKVEGRSHQTPLSPAEVRAMARETAARPVPSTHAEFMQAVRELTARKGWA